MKQTLRANRQATGPTEMILCADEFREIARQLRGASANARVFVVAWAPTSPAETSLADLLAALPPKAAVILTGSYGGLPVWKALTTGDLRALADQFTNRWIVIEPDPRQAVVGAMQQLADEDALLILRPPTVSTREVEYWIEAVEQYRELSQAWDE